MGEGDGFGGETFGGEGDYGGSEGFGGMGLGSDPGASFGDIGGFGDAIGDSFGLEGLFGLTNPDIGFNQDIGDLGYGMPADLGQAMEGLSGNSLSNFLDSLPKGLKGLLGMLDKSGVLGKGLGLASMATNPDQGKAWGGALGSMFGGMMAGPVGAMALGALGSNMGQGAFSGLSSPGGATAAAEGMSSGMDMSSILNGLGGIYSGYQGMKSAGDMLGGLQGLYSQNSPYAQQLRQALARQDAASGRRSQYGNREVELQARLAQMASNQIPAMNQLSSRQNTMRAQMLQNGIGLFNALGGLNGLQGLFGSGGSPLLQMPEYGTGMDLGGLFGNGNIDQGFDPNSIDWGF